MLRFSCARCGKRYVTHDVPIAGRIYRLKCKACGELIVVRGSAVAPPPTAEASGTFPAIETTGSIQALAPPLGTLDEPLGTPPPAVSRTPVPAGDEPAVVPTPTPEPLAPPREAPVIPLAAASPVTASPPPPAAEPAAPPVPEPRYVELFGPADPEAAAVDPPAPYLPPELAPPEGGWEPSLEEPGVVDPADDGAHPDEPEAAPEWPTDDAVQDFSVRDFLAPLDPLAAGQPLAPEAPIEPEEAPEPAAAPAPEPAPAEAQAPAPAVPGFFPAGPPTPLRTSPPRPSPSFGRARRRHSTVLPLLALVVTLIAGAAAFAIWRPGIAGTRHPAPPPAATPAPPKAPPAEAEASTPTAPAAPAVDQGAGATTAPSPPSATAPPPPAPAVQAHEHPLATPPARPAAQRPAPTPRPADRAPKPAKPPERKVAAAEPALAAQVTAPSPAPAAPAPAAPDATGEQATPDLPTGLAPEQIQRVLGGARKSFDACLKNPSRGLDQPLGERQVTLRFVVDPGGSVGYPTIDDVVISSAPVGQCLKAAAKGLSFPSFRGDPVSVDQPVSIPAR